MVRALIVGDDAKFPAEFTTAMEENGARIHRAGSSEAAKKKVAEEKFDLVVVDETLSDTQGLACVKELIGADAFLNCSLVSSLSKGDFHEETEGLGLLMQLPVPPKGADAVKLLERLNRILNPSF